MCALHPKVWYWAKSVVVPKVQVCESVSVPKCGAAQSVLCAQSKWGKASPNDFTWLGMTLSHRELDAAQLAKLAKMA